MPLGMAPQVIEPAAASSPAWVQHLVGRATIWSNHPVTAAAAAVWIQVGIGVWLLVAPRGKWSRLAGLASVAVGPRRLGLRRGLRRDLRSGLSWLFGAPGAACSLLLRRRAGRAARASVADGPARAARAARDGRVLPRHGGAAGLARTRASGRASRHAGRTRDADRRWSSRCPDPPAALALASLVELRRVRRRARLGGQPVRGGRPRRDWGALFQRAACRSSASPSWPACALPGRLGAGQDLGFLGGVGTDPNSMIPMAPLPVPATWP